MEEWKPNLFVAGFAKCGTTALSAYLNQHPCIYVIKNKEPFTLVGHLIDKEINLNFYTSIWNIKYFHDMFSHLPFTRYQKYYIQNWKKVRADCSTVYTYHISFANIIKEFSPKAKVILCIREQKERLISTYLFTYPSHRLQFNEWINKIMPYINEYLFYNYIVEYAKLFNNNLLVIDNKILQEEPQIVLNKVFDFLGIEHINIHPLVSNISLISPSHADNIYNYYVSLYERIQYKLNRLSQSLYNTPLYDSKIHTLLSIVRDKINSIISYFIFHIYNRKKNTISIEKRKLLSEIPTALAQLLDNDYKHTIELCKEKHILLRQRN